MPTFDYTFTVDAPRSAVRAFHHDTSVLKKLMPPPIFVQIHHYDPLAEGSVAEFTLWFGPFPVRWKAIHSDVGENGFTDTQVNGLLKKWQHTHRFTPISDDVTQVNEHIEYEYESGIRGLIGRLFFSKPALTLLFTIRKLITRREIRKASVTP
jgi:ligand-binding SRPBCC domain-containing protein